MTKLGVPEAFPHSSYDDRVVHCDHGSFASQCLVFAALDDDEGGGVVCSPSFALLLTGSFAASGATVETLSPISPQRAFSPLKGGWEKHFNGPRCQLVDECLLTGCCSTLQCRRGGKIVKVKLMERRSHPRELLLAPLLGHLFSGPRAGSFCHAI